MVKYFYSLDKKPDFQNGDIVMFDDMFKAAEEAVCDYGSEDPIYIFKAEVNLIKIAKNTLILSDIKKGK